MSASVMAMPGGASSAAARNAAVL